MMVEKNINLQLQALDVLRKKFGMGTLAVEVSPGDQEVLTKASDLAADVQNEPMAKALASSDYEAKRLEALKPVKAPIRGVGMPEAPQLTAFDAVETPSDVESDEIEQRQAYLKEQRDKLIALKKEVREGQLRAEANKSRRPRTARAAQDTIQGNSAGVEIDPDTLEIRKALAGKLRQELVDNPDL
ncbi:unnamed protein product [Notodromas monacha]|uniref:Uncharacterized protein n=1 Tax=Notodromas monacha TaxID=399045 RepID=A0A7R9GJN3_9CRUS|nr:unnamed protein product [Notodromas monacha]CAG0925169.1 unnamed protein product [Notodromas monacha]